MHSPLTTKTTLVLGCLGLLMMLTGCKTVDSTAASKFAASVTNVKAQADTVLTAAAASTRAEGVAFVATQPTLSEADFAETPASDVIVEWDDLFSAIETYALNLAALSSPNVTAPFDAAATNLFDQFTQTATRINANALSSTPARTAGISAAFAEMAHLILEAKAQAAARKVAAQTDPQMGRLFTLLADEIGADHTSPCLRTTIYRTWNTQKDALNGPFLRAADLGAKTAIAQQYETILANRALEDASLASLRNALLALAQAHHALAQGDEVSAQAAMTFTANELQRTQVLYSQFSADLKPKK
jgi:hypothetical protein